MLCRLCETFLTNIVHEDFSTWRRIEQGWSTFKHGNYASILANADAGCEVCSMFDIVRSERTFNYRELNEKWQVQAASIVIKYDYDKTDVGRVDLDGHLTPKGSFQLLTVAPEMSWIPFELFNPDSQHTEFGRKSRQEFLQYKLAVAKSPTSRGTIDIARTWVDECLSHHVPCRRSTSAPLPTRVIELGSSDEKPTPRLQINDNGELGQYVTLSHCWGTGSELKLTDSNREAFRKAIPFDQLPRTFQDAIQISMALGVRYIWIDALCIMQDDRDDWRRESASMGAVFENALFSMSALTAEDSNSGILHDRAAPSAVVQLGGTTFGVRNRIDSLPQALRRARLETRAWCYQERLLPRAILHIAPEQMHWECRAGVFSESLPRHSAEAVMNIEPSKALLSVSGEITSRTTTTDWLRLVSEYSSRDITKPSDRLPAIAGLADRVQKQMGDAVYLQGLWSHGLYAQVLWRRSKLMHGRIIPSRDKYLLRAALSKAERPREYIAPSFSWASLNNAVEYPMHEEFPFRREVGSDAVFGTHHLQRQSQHINVEGLVKRGSCKPVASKLSQTDQAIFRPSSSQLVDEGLVCFLDFVDEPVSRGCYCLRIADWSQSSTSGSKKKRQDTERACYLILEKSSDGASGSNTEEPSTFKRVGMGFDVVAKVDKIFANADRRELRLV
ncbi:hypothetical protein LTR09_002138 [Extremus antarcticus]|uniref:Heterokaryon incompatibility domain-containing protein n=1 Tax=Extremus antarcticus TaxID=702011 RepID=A0AAJ0GGK1_9PEZI|nr:hypothetical protein LTR09_002138 [Extremus antarcticus]